MLNMYFSNEIISIAFALLEKVSTTNKYLIQININSFYYQMVEGVFRTLYFLIIQKVNDLNNFKTYFLKTQ